MQTIMLKFNCTILFLCFLLITINAQDLLFEETKVDQVYSEYGLDGTGVIVAVMDRGIDYTHPDFQNDDGTTRILGIFDLSTDLGSNDADNPYGVGTIHTQEEINSALNSGTLITRDAVGHGTVTAGIAAGNGRASEGRISGIAPKASIVVVKFTSEGAPAHGSQAAEESFYRVQELANALQFVEDISEEYDMPFVMGANFGSSGDSMDGTSSSCRTINEYFGTGKKGKVFLTGSSDDGGIENHAQVQLSNGLSEEIRFIKSDNGFLRFSAWYSELDDLTLKLKLQDGTTIDYDSPANESSRVQDFQTTYNFYHNGSSVDFSTSLNSKREILIDFFGPAGEYSIELSGVNISNGRIDAWLNPSNIFASPDNKFLNNVVPGYTIWDWATASANINFNGYILRESYQDINGFTRIGIAGNDAGIGNLWPGSGVGPVLNDDGGIIVSVPGNINFGAYTTHGYWSTLDFLLLEDEGREYGILAAVSGANPVITGVVALMLQANPELDASEIKEILKETARSDQQTGAVPNDNWGYGKLDAFAAVQRVMNLSSNSDEEIDPLSIWPNPTLDYLFVSDQVAEGDFDFIVYNNLGKTVQLGKSKNARFDVSSLEPGIYHLIIYNDGVLQGRNTFIKN